MEMLRRPLRCLSSFHSIVLYVQCMLYGQNIAVHWFMTKLPWNRHRLYIIRFFWESALKRSRIHKHKTKYWALVCFEEIRSSSYTATQESGR